MSELREALEQAMESSGEDQEDITLQPKDDDFLKDEPQELPDIDIEGYKKSNDEPDDRSRQRDENGRFAKNDKYRQENNQQPDEQLTFSHEDHQILEKRPQSFRRGDLWENMVAGKVSPQDQKELAKYYIERENQYHKGIAVYKDAAAKNSYLSTALEPFVPRLLQENIDPAQFITRLANAHYNIVNSDPQKKAAIFNQLATEYGINFVQTQQGYSATPMDYQTQALHQKIQSYEQEINDMKEWRESQNRDIINQQINSFASDRTNFPHFDGLLDQMADLLDKGVANDLPSAYKIAERLDDSLWQQRISNGGNPANKTRQVQKAKSLAISPKTTAPAPSAGKKHSGSLRQTLESVFDDL